MTEKQIYLLCEGALGLVLSFFGIFSVPALVNSHDTIALACAIGLFCGWIGWFIFFNYRVMKELK